ncbi:hypothetical protein XBP1_330040 [Xenorhabdus bovienii str. puntauvense]|uniref:Uncharacterized protein n=2 Tax=Xenorhabdus bovienii TaxID=40576 RepID=A0A077NJK9_XENBV|nr:hypothetical protein XBP1_330040 [Xenorhabdus bovienii str. puntauvense]CDH01319.1 hypothetical protein XBFM1_2050087 [Xenorhabdus bovienii str. feltiae Moldova]
MEFLPSYDEFLILINMTAKLEDNINFFILIFTKIEMTYINKLIYIRIKNNKI